MEEKWKRELEIGLRHDINILLPSPFRCSWKGLFQFEIKRGMRIRRAKTLYKLYRQLSMRDHKTRVVKKEKKRISAGGNRENTRSRNFG